ncbi:hypothetical protein EVAR_16130_1 [Eumeta japonica]|uniref:C2H2-type domain-containing protein n=1 Tax=Eumeta variegata TaxID=151549 RepID=A0A4C1UJY9_EUMVA|nr:hypothetical protein EVAR_16130_1 [Eumeta japonica]
MEISCERDLRVSSEATFMSDVRKTDDVLHLVIREPPRDSSIYCVVSHTEFGVRTDVSKIKFKTHIGSKDCKCEHCELNTTRNSDMINRIATCAHENPCKRRHCKHSASRLCTSKIRNHSYIAENRYACEQCEYCTSRRSHLKTHIG